MKAIRKCEVCGGKIIQAGNGNIFCENCADKSLGEKLQAWADWKEKQRIARLANEQLTIPATVGQSELLKTFADYVQGRMWEVENKDLSEFIEEFLSL